MTEIGPSETHLVGKWLYKEGRVVEEGTSCRISELIRNHLVKLGHDQSGWDTLYRDPVDRRFWELIYPESDRHGGGPPELRFLPAEEAERKYGSVALK